MAFFSIRNLLRTTRQRASRWRRVEMAFFSIRNLVLLALALALFGVLFFAASVATSNCQNSNSNVPAIRPPLAPPSPVPTNCQNSISSLSPIVSSLSAIVAIVVALSADLDGRDRRKRKSARLDKERIASRKRVAASYAGVIKAWLERKDLEEVVADLRRIDERNLLVTTVEQLLGTYRPDVDVAKETAIDLWPTVIEYVKETLRLAGFKSMSDLPSVWATAFGRADVGVLEGTAPTFFLDMGTIWMNLNLQARLLSAHVEQMRDVRKNESSNIPSLVRAIAADATELREQINDFLTVAKRAGDTLADYPAETSAEVLKTPSDLVEKSRLGSKRFSEAWQPIDTNRAFDPMIEMQNGLTQRFADALKEAEKPTRRV